MMLLIAGIVLIVSGVLGFILQLHSIRENQTENAASN